jgi:hypothetical protein
MVLGKAAKKRGRDESLDVPEADHMLDFFSQ